MSALQDTTLIILPGWGGSAETWKDFVSAITLQFHAVHIVELPCFGKEPCPANVWGVEEYAAFAKKKIELISGRKVILGHSFGGQVASYLVATSPSLCDTLILSGAAVIRPKNHCKRFIFGLMAKLGKIILRIPVFSAVKKRLQHVLYTLADSPDYTETSDVKREIFRKVIRQDMRYILSHITLPTLVISGDKDRYVPLRFSKKVARMIPDATVSVVKKGTHGLHHKKFLPAYIKEITHFLTR